MQRDTPAPRPHATPASLINHTLALAAVIYQSSVMSEFNPSKSVLCGAEESMARCPLLLAVVVVGGDALQPGTETRRDQDWQQEGGGGFQRLNSPCLSRPLWEVRTLQ